MHPALVTGAAFYAGVGLTALVRPALVPAIFGGQASTASSRTEVRAVYGGLPLAMAGMVVREARQGTGAHAGGMTDAVALLSAAMAAGRVVGSVLEGEADGVTRVFVALEAATAAALALGARRSRAGLAAARSTA